MEAIEFFFSSRRRHTRLQGDWSSDVCSKQKTAYVRVREVQSSGSDGNRASSNLTASSTSSFSPQSFEPTVNDHRPLFGIRVLPLGLEIGTPFRSASVGAQRRSAET